MRADFEACETYTVPPGARLAIPISAYAGTDDPTTSPDQVGAWRELTTGRFHLRRFAGGHFFLSGRKVEVAQHIIADVIAARSAENDTGGRSLLGVA
jgi:surfactin synthase thioesterase subunit